MKKDIPIYKVEDVAVAIIPEEGDTPEFWEVYLVNLKEHAIDNILVNSTGYGQVDGENVKTTTLRYFYEHIPATSCVKIEILQHKLRKLANEYWISFWLNGHMYDKKYIFVQGSLDSTNFTEIPILNRDGVMIM